MPETREPAGRETDRAHAKRKRSRPGSEHADPRKHAAELLDQADRLTELADELRREARRLNEALGNPAPRPTGSVKPAERRGHAAPGPAPQSRAPDDLPISEGARLMIANLANGGSKREEILGVMRDQLGLENADAILDRMSL
jgi:hypothetical protein